MDSLALHEAAIRQAEVARLRLSNLRLAYRQQGVKKFIQGEAQARRDEYEQYQQRDETTDASQ